METANDMAIDHISLLGRQGNAVDSSVLDAYMCEIQKIIKDSKVIFKFEKASV